MGTEMVGTTGSHLGQGAEEVEPSSRRVVPANEGRASTVASSRLFSSVGVRAGVLRAKQGQGPRDEGSGH